MAADQEVAPDGLRGRAGDSSPAERTVRRLLVKPKKKNKQLIRVFF